MPQINLCQRKKNFFFEMFSFTSLAISRLRAQNIQEN